MVHSTVRLAKFDPWERKILIPDQGFLTARRKGHFSMSDIRAIACSRFSVSGDDQKSIQTTPSPSPRASTFCARSHRTCGDTVCSASGSQNTKPKKHGNSLFLAANINKENAQSAPNPRIFFPLKRIYFLFEIILLRKNFLIRINPRFSVPRRNLENSSKTPPFLLHGRV